MKLIKLFMIHECLKCEKRKRRKKINRNLFCNFYDFKLLHVWENYGVVSLIFSTQCRMGWRRKITETTLKFYWLSQWSSITDFFGWYALNIFSIRCHLDVPLCWAYPEFFLGVQRFFHFILVHSYGTWW